MKFNGSFTTQSRGMEVVLYHEEEKAMALSFKLEFSCSNNTTEYEAYLIGLATALEMGIKHLRVMGDSNLVVLLKRTQPSPVQSNGLEDGGKVFNL